MKIEAAVAALTVTAVETFALVMGVATADGEGDGGKNRVTTNVLCNEEGGAMTARAMATRVVGERRRRR